MRDTKNLAARITQQIDLHRNSINALEGALLHTDIDAYEKYWQSAHPTTNTLVDRMKELYEPSLNGANDTECAYWNKAINACIAITLESRS